MLAKGRGLLVGYRPPSSYRRLEPFRSDVFRGCVLVQKWSRHNETHPFCHPRAGRPPFRRVNLLDAAHATCARVQQQQQQTTPAPTAQWNHCHPHGGPRFGPGHGCPPSPRATPPPQLQFSHHPLPPHHHPCLLPHVRILPHQ